MKQYQRLFKRKLHTFVSGRFEPTPKTYCLLLNWRLNRLSHCGAFDIQRSADTYKL